MTSQTRSRTKVASRDIAAVGPHGLVCAPTAWAIAICLLALLLIGMHIGASSEQPTTTSVTLGADVPNRDGRPETGAERQRGRNPAALGSCPATTTICATHLMLRRLAPYAPLLAPTPLELLGLDPSSPLFTRPDLSAFPGAAQRDTVYRAVREAQGKALQGYRLAWRRRRREMGEGGSEDEEDENDDMEEDVAMSVDIIAQQEVGSHGTTARINTNINVDIGGIGSFEAAVYHVSAMLLNDETRTAFLRHVQPQLVQAVASSGASSSSSWLWMLSRGPRAGAGVNNADGFTEEQLQARLLAIEDMCWDAWDDMGWS